MKCSPSRKYSEERSLIRNVEAVSLCLDGGCCKGRVRNYCFCLTQMFVQSYQGYLGLLWSQGFDFDHAILDLEDVLLMGQKRGKFPGFYHRLYHETGTA